MYDSAKEMAEDLALETQRANDWEAKYTELLAEHVQLLGKYGEIVRCGECKYWEKSNNAVWCRRTAIGIFRMEEDDFCSKGEKKDD
jgi:hypothetical protein